MNALKAILMTLSSTVLLLALILVGFAFLPSCSNQGGPLYLKDNKDGTYSPMQAPAERQDSDPTHANRGTNNKVAESRPTHGTSATPPPGAKVTGRKMVTKQTGKVLRVHSDGRKEIVSAGTPAPEGATERKNPGGVIIGPDGKIKSLPSGVNLTEGEADALIGAQGAYKGPGSR